MSALISSIYYSPVKSLSFQSVQSCEIKKNLGILNDRIFAFSKIINIKRAKFIEKNPNERNLNNFLTLKNSPVLNKYNFIYKENKLTLMLGTKELISILEDDLEQRFQLINKLVDLENSLLRPICLLKNKEFPFYDTTHSDKIFNSISLINLNSVKDFGKKINENVEFERFRGNFYVDGVDAWEERNWIGKIIKINNIFFKVERNIPRCIAINLKPKTDDNKLNLLQSLNFFYDHFDMGIYLRSLSGGEIKVGNKIDVS
tara:strand:- start:231 stop:1007 length:777 start_codon:yes stop_codon:yes gene_type:complete